jgi:hypothetical protein
LRELLDQERPRHKQEASPSLSDGTSFIFFFPGPKEAIVETLALVFDPPVEAEEEDAGDEVL